MTNAKMVLEIGELRFEKYPKASTVNVYVDERNIDCFTHYDIGSDFDKFEESCEEYYHESMSENE